MRLFYMIGLVICLQNLGFAQQTGGLNGEIIDKNTQKPISGATVKLINTTYVTTSDSLGKYVFRNIPTGQYQITVISLGSLPYNLYNVIVSSGNITSNSIELIPQDFSLKAVTVGSNKKSVRAATLETPLSIQKLTAEEIKSNPGGNFDISKVVQTLPGVTGSASTGAGFRNDIIVRGGAPNENVFYLDGIEIPVINHFTTQGSAGGPQGILNVSFIDEVKLSSSAFDAKYDNALSSVFEFKQKKGNAEKVQGNVRLSATEMALTLEGPLQKKGKTTYLLSARRSYLQFLFKALDLPIRPNFWDFQYKITHTINPKTTLTFLGVGAIDEFAFAAPKKATPEKIYALNAGPSINQWNYTVGVSLKKLIDRGFWNLSISRNQLNNLNERFQNNLGPDKGEKTLDYTSNESGNNLRWDITKSIVGFKWTTGVNLQNIQYDNSTNQLLQYRSLTTLGGMSTPTNPLSIQYDNQLNYNKYGAFFQVGKKAFNNRLGISAGLRVDGNSYTNDGAELLKRLSPRVSLSYVISNEWSLNASIGKYFKLPPNTSLGYKDSTGMAVNKTANYTSSLHYVVGLEYIPSDANRFTAEVFYKKYEHVPISVNKGVSLSNLGADFNILGNEPISTSGLGRSYGFELFAQQKLTDRFFGIVSYSFFKSEYSNASGKYIPSSWQNTHLLSMTGGYKFNKNWELGIKYRYQGGTPYTPYDMNLSKINFATLGVGVLDYNNLNTLTNTAFHSADLRVDKKYYFKKTTLDCFIDITNFYGAKSVAPPFYVFSANSDGTFKTTDGQAVKKDGSNALPVLFDNNQVFITPTFGFILEF
jgi:outer membrane receptor for ferrienterochelin and colicin